MVALVHFSNSMAEGMMAIFFFLLLESHGNSIMDFFFSANGNAHKNVFVLVMFICSFFITDYLSFLHLSFEIKLPCSM